MSPDHFTAAPGFDLRNRIREIELPATTEQLVAHARANGGSERELRTLARLPARRWESLDEAVAAATSGWKETETEGA